MADAHLQAVADEIETILAAIQYDSAYIFGTGGARVYWQGENPSTEFPQAVIVFQEERAQELEQGPKMSLRLPWSVAIRFDAHGIPDDKTTPLARHLELYALVRDAIMGSQTARTLNGTAQDTRYAGGGSALEIINPEASDQAAGWQFRLDFETLYRTLTTDSRTQA